MTWLQAPRLFALGAATLASLMAVPALAQDRNPQRQAEVAQLQSQITTLEQQVLELRLAMGELQLLLAQVQANPLGTSPDLVIGGPRTRSVTIVTDGRSSLLVERRKISVNSDTVLVDGKVVDIKASAKIDISGNPVNVKATSDTIIKGSKVKSN